uniref:Helicase ATP-binding domain-containing protein n=1 Tax=Sexangularia sp. CB-2014 TaxID=1486929 RepID=A0A7S1YFG4_9EUKA|mmetsp:Transcript_1857/g.5905  ORF Transcript_1857/g.5905 Transcript_1857/m.5905 type:complete len:1326 (+) Transcript_1857:162-4139(+)
MDGATPITLIKAKELIKEASLASSSTEKQLTLKPSTEVDWDAWHYLSACTAVRVVGLAASFPGAFARRKGEPDISFPNLRIDHEMATALISSFSSLDSVDLAQNVSFSPNEDMIVLVNRLQSGASEYKVTLKFAPYVKVAVDKSNDVFRIKRAGVDDEQGRVDFHTIVGLISKIEDMPLSDLEKSIFRQQTLAQVVVDPKSRDLIENFIREIEEGVLSMSDALETLEDSSRNPREFIEETVKGRLRRQARIRKETRDAKADLNQMRRAMGTIEQPGGPPEHEALSASQQGGGEAEYGHRRIAASIRDSEDSTEDSLHREPRRGAAKSPHHLLSDFEDALGDVEEDSDDFQDSESSDSDQESSDLSSEESEHHYELDMEDLDGTSESDEEYVATSQSDEEDSPRQRQPQARSILDRIQDEAAIGGVVELPNIHDSLVDSDDSGMLDVVEFLVRSKVDELWGVLFAAAQPADLEKAAQNATTRFGVSKFEQKVKLTFMREVRDVIALMSMIRGRKEHFSRWNPRSLIVPHSYQALVAVRLNANPEKVVGNWSGTGTGKTIAAIISARYIGATRMLYIAPLPVCTDSNGVSAALEHVDKRLMNDTAIVRLRSPKDWDNIQDSLDAKERDPHVRFTTILVPFTHFQRTNPILWCDRLELDIVVIDEVQHAKGNSGQAKNIADAISMLRKNSGEMRVLASSATPFANRPAEGFRVLQVLTGKPPPTKRSPLNTPQNLHKMLKVLPSVRKMGKFTETREILVPVSSTLRELQEDPDVRLQSYEIDRLLTKYRIKTIVEEAERSVRERKSKVLVYSDRVGGHTGEILRYIGTKLEESKLSVGYFAGEGVVVPNANDRDEDKRKFTDLPLGHPDGIDVLVGSSAISTGVDGLQTHCGTIIFNTLPWTSSDYMQVVGRIARQGTVQKEVQVIIPIIHFHAEDNCGCAHQSQDSNNVVLEKGIASTSAENRIEYARCRSPCKSYCQRKYDLLRRKHSLLEVVLDGSWERGEPLELERVKLLRWAITDLLALAPASTIKVDEGAPHRRQDPKEEEEEFDDALSGGADVESSGSDGSGQFTQVKFQLRDTNALWYAKPTAELHSMVQQDRAIWVEYHQLCRDAYLGRVRQGAIAPPCIHSCNVIRRESEDRPRPIKVADFGCGLAYVANELLNVHQGEGYEVRSFDHEIGTSCDAPWCEWLVRDSTVEVEKADCGAMDETVMQSEHFDFVVVCCALMGPNLGVDILRNAFRVLKPMGQLLLTEFPCHLGDFRSNARKFFAEHLSPLGFVSREVGFVPEKYTGESTTLFFFHCEKSNSPRLSQAASPRVPRKKRRRQS